MSRLAALLRGKACLALSKRLEDPVNFCIGKG